MQQTIFVPGGSGFIGQEVCRTAIGSGHEVRALSRSGKPNIDEAWVDLVSWIKGDALDAGSWRHHLEKCDAVIHCIGLLQEDPLKGETFERINAETAITVAGEAEAKGVSSFVMLSNSVTPPLIPDRFLTAKRHAEQHIKHHLPKLRSVFFRPSFVYGRRRPSSMIVGRAVQCINLLPPFVRVPSAIPLPVETVAAAAVYAALHQDVEGVIGETEIEDLAQTKAESLLMPPRHGLRTQEILFGAAIAAIAAGIMVKRRA